MGRKVIIRFWWNLGYCLHPETISPLFADLLTTTHDCVPRLFTLSKTIVFILSAMAGYRSSDHSGYITDFCSMIELLHELKNSSC